jgi:DNA polymerase III sliding clamp (beta) subunit (PCNA family)
MKVTCHNDLLTKLVNRVSGANQKGSSPADVSQYITLSASGGNLSASVARDDFAVFAHLESGRLNDSLTIVQDGKYVLNGEAVVHDLNTSTTNDVVTLEHKKDDVRNIVQEPKDGDAPPAPKNNGCLYLSRPGPKKNTVDLTKFYTVDLNLNIDMEFKAEKKITVQCDVFAKALKQVGISVGKATMQLDYSNILVKVVGPDKVQMVTTNGQQLTVSTIDAVDADEGASVILPYDKVVAITKMCDEKRTLTIHIVKGSPRTVFFSQYIMYGQDGDSKENAVGECKFRLREPACKFANYEPLIKSLSFVAKCKAQTQVIRALCSRIYMADTVKTATVFDPESEVIALSKKSPTVDKTVNLPIVDAEGSRMELDLSSNHLAAAAGACEDSTIEFAFSGPKSLECMRLGPNLVTYFQPFRNQE